MIQPILRFKIIPLKFYRTISISKDLRNVKKWINWINLINWTVFQVRGPCNLLVGTMFSCRTYCLYLLMACENDLECSSRTFIKSTRLYCVLIHVFLRILNSVVTSNPVSENIKNNLSGDGNDTFWELNYRRAVCF